MEREYLISLCDKAIINEKKWSNRDSVSAQTQIGTAWVLLKAGCDFEANEENGFVDLKIKSRGFGYFEIGDYDSDFFYIPTQETLDKFNGDDWY